MLGGRGVYDVEPPIAAERHLRQSANCHRGPRRRRKALLFGLPGAFPRIEDDGLHRVLPFRSGMLLTARPSSTWLLMRVRGRAGGSFTGSIPVRQNSDIDRNGVSSDRVLGPLRRDA